MQKERLPDQELLNLLEHDPQSGMEAAVEQFTALLWKVGKKHLQNPEDIKECINDVFLELYTHRDRFDSEKGTLTVYLTQIMRNLAINRYRKNVLWENQTPDCLDESTSDQEQVEAQIDLEQAMASLKPEDAKIIRMKYYGGMTVREIAASLDLPYDTVKKRHQRSLSKLRMLMLGILVLGLLALLTACAYVLLRYFGIIPGYGISKDSKDLIFTLEEPVQMEDGNGIYFIRDAMLFNEQMYVLIEYWAANQEIKEEMISEIDATVHRFEVETDRNFVTLNGEPVNSLSVYSGGTSVNQRSECWVILLDVRLSGLEEIPGWDGGIEIAFTRIASTLTCRLVQVKADQITNYPYQIDSRGGLLAIPRLEDGRLIVGIYPLNTGMETVLTSLLRGVLMEGKVGDVMVTAPDGQELVGECVFGPSFTSGYFREWDFGPAQPGEYTLHVPYVCLSVPVEEPDSFHLDLQNGTWDEQKIPVPGGTLFVESCQPMEVPIGEPIPGVGGPFTMSGDCRVWSVRLRYDPSEDMVMTMCLPAPDETMEVQKKVFYDVAVSDDGSPFPFKTDGFRCDLLTYGKEDNIIELSVCGWDGCYDPANVVLTISDPLSMRWEHNFDLPLQVEAETEN